MGSVGRSVGKEAVVDKIEDLLSSTSTPHHESSHHEQVIYRSPVCLSLSLTECLSILLSGPFSLALSLALSTVLTLTPDPIPPRYHPASNPHVLSHLFNVSRLPITYPLEVLSSVCLQTSACLRAAIHTS